MQRITEYATLSSFLSDGKIVFIFGAGSAKPYGFPLWDELKNNLIEVISHRSFPKSVASVELITWLKNNRDSDANIDHWVWTASKGNPEIYEVFRRACGLALLRVERHDNDGNWIRVFAKKIEEYLLSRDRLYEVFETLDNLKFVTLNYDRSFEQLFFSNIDFNNVFKRFMVNEMDIRALIIRACASFFQVIHPHGVVSDLMTLSNPKQNIVVPRIDLHKFGALPYGRQIDPSDPIGKGILVVSDAVGKRNTAYDLANRELLDAQHAVIVGLSMSGLENSAFKFPNHLSVKFWSPEDCPPGLKVEYMPGDAMDFAQSL